MTEVVTTVLLNLMGGTLCFLAGLGGRVTTDALLEDEDATLGVGRRLVLPFFACSTTGECGC